MANQKHLQWASYVISAVLVGVLVTLLMSGRGARWFQQAELSPKPVPLPAQNETQDPFQMVIKGKLVEVQECYNSQLKRGLNKSGKLVVRWSVDASGASSDFQEELNELDSVELYDCTTTAITSWPFPKNRPIQIRYTFKMRALEKEKLIREISSLDGEEAY